MTIARVTGTIETMSLIGAARPIVTCRENNIVGSKIIPMLKIGGPKGQVAC